MTGTSNEFARPIRLDTLGEDLRPMSIEATEAERAALALRFDLVSLDSLVADLGVRRMGDIVHAEGRVRASVTQACVATAEALPSRHDVPFSLRFVPDAQVATDEETELDEAGCDTIGYSGGAIDIGEAAAETLYLALDPFPRAADADATLRKAGVLREGDEEQEDGPLAAALKGLGRPRN